MSTPSLGRNILICMLSRPWGKQGTVNQYVSFGKRSAPDIQRLLCSQSCSGIITPASCKIRLTFPSSGPISQPSPSSWAAEKGHYTRKNDLSSIRSFSPLRPHSLFAVWQKVTWKQPGSDTLLSYSLTIWMLSPSKHCLTCASVGQVHYGLPWRQLCPITLTSMAILRVKRTCTMWSKVNVFLKVFRFLKAMHVSDLLPDTSSPNEASSNDGTEWKRFFVFFLSLWRGFIFAFTKNTEWWSSLTIERTYAAGAVKHLLKAEYNSFPKTLMRGG